MNPLKLIVILYVICLPFAANAGAQKDYILMLDGSWKFQIGDNPEWATGDYDDSEWETINVPSTWEDQGFFGYDGFAWYRKEFILKDKDIRNRDIYITLGYIDDADQVYINGKLVGFSGSFPPHFSTALEVVRKYPIPIEYLNLQGKNVISVRVYDHHMSGGISSGVIGIFAGKGLKPDIPLVGLWHFRAGDNLTWKNKDHNDKNWRKIVVPGNWKTQGYRDFNGIAWYRMRMVIPEEYENQKMVFLLGQIDHCDEVYINGEKIGSTGLIPDSKHSKDSDYFLDECGKPRAYILPDNLLHIKKDNTIAIRVYNDKFRGGIIEGPVGMIRLSRFNKEKAINTEE